MTPTECAVGRTRAGYKNGDIIPIYSDGWAQTTTAIPYPGCKLRFEACKSCKFHVVVEAQLPTCNKISVGKQCIEG